MLQQTRAEAVIRYYDRFLAAFPDVEALADADEDSVLKLWEGLGYYSRARNLHAAAKKVTEAFGGVFPTSSAELRALPGVGPYAANAIASIAYGEPVPALDGNQARVLARVEGWTSPLKTPFDLEAQAMSLMDFPRPGDYNQSLMDLGARICTPKAPDCEACPVRDFCCAAEEGDPESFPRKKPPIVKQELELTIAVLQCDGRFAVCRRPSSGLLGGLYEFPSLEGRLSAQALCTSLEAMGFQGVRIQRELAPSKHVFSHLIWRMTGYHALADAVPEGWLLVDTPAAVAFPSALRVYREFALDLSNEEG